MKSLLIILLTLLILTPLAHSSPIKRDMNLRLPLGNYKRFKSAAEKIKFSREHPDIVEKEIQKEIAEHNDKDGTNLKNYLKGRGLPMTPEAEFLEAKRRMELLLEEAKVIQKRRRNL